MVQVLDRKIFLYVNQICKQGVRSRKKRIHQNRPNPNLLLNWRNLNRKLFQFETHISFSNFQMSNKITISSENYIWIEAKYDREKSEID